MKSRERLGAADLFVRLDREFRRRRRRDCAECSVPYPYRVERGEGEPNWDITIPPACGKGCDLLLEEIAGELRSRYDMSVEPD